jgi:5-methylcytosine-specific restriction endonuclease McrA
MTGQVLVLNATYEPLNVCSLRRACVLLLKSKAELIDALERPLRSASASLPYPVVIRLLSYVRRPRAAARRITRRAVFARDGHSCQYCGVEGVRLTVDHVLPRSRGGPSSWDNAVTACAPCNLRKGDRSLQQAGMELPHPPRPPQPVLFIKLAAPRIPQRWTPYLGDLGTATAAA